jgi:hypothetical protein
LVAACACCLLYAPRSALSHDGYGSGCSVALIGVQLLNQRGKSRIQGLIEHRIVERLQLTPETFPRLYIEHRSGFRGL